MKIQCDVCSKKEASVYCSADEAALCDDCDQSIHHANKLASKHQRLSLIQPSASNFPICDICQEKRALIFCQQDRAILCRDCEIPLHTSNEHTKKHNRFLLTGIKLSSTTMISNKNFSKKDDAIIISNNNDNGCDHPAVPNFKPTKILPCDDLPEQTRDYSNSDSTAASLVTNSKNADSLTNNNQLINGGSTTSNISEYLIDMLPGWHFEDLIVDSASPAPFGFCKSNQNFEVNEDVMSFFEDKELTSCSSAHQSENFWVPQATHFTTNAGISSNVFGQQQQQHHQHSSSGIQHNYTSGINFGTKQQQQQETTVNSMKMNRKYLKDDVFTVPQICPSVGSKRNNRPFW